jgi:hypothetical protein
MQQEVNIKVGNKAPETYFSEVLNQCHTGELKYGAIATRKELSKNLEENCIPESVFTMTIENYQEFLMERRKLIAKKIKAYYYSL